MKFYPTGCAELPKPWFQNNTGGGQNYYIEHKRFSVLNHPDYTLVVQKFARGYDPTNLQVHAIRYEYKHYNVY